MLFVVIIIVVVVAVVVAAVAIVVKGMREIREGNEREGRKCLSFQYFRPNELIITQDYRQLYTTVVAH